MEYLLLVIVLAIIGWVIYKLAKKKEKVTPSPIEPNEAEWRSLLDNIHTVLSGLEDADKEDEYLKSIQYDIDKFWHILEFRQKYEEEIEKYKN